jgi:hypothetical protein
VSFDVCRTPADKHASWVIYGASVAPDAAHEIIRRTDTFFHSCKSASVYQYEVRRLLGAPRDSDYFWMNAAGDESYDTEQLHRDCEAFRVRWGLLSVETLANAQVAIGLGWCFADGTIGIVEELDGWSHPRSIRDECKLLANAFPQLAFSIAYWGRGGQEAPTAGIMVRNGRVDGVAGDDPVLFRDFGCADWRQAKESAQRAHDAARSRNIARSRYGDRGDSSGLPDSVIESWIAKAREVGTAS